jgi:hypothetical protein
MRDRTFGVIIKDEDGTVISEEHGLVGKGSAMSNNVAHYRRKAVW